MKAHVSQEGFSEEEFPRDFPRRLFWFKSALDNSKIRTFSDVGDFGQQSNNKNKSVNKWINKLNFYTFQHYFESMKLLFPQDQLAIKWEHFKFTLVMSKEQIVW